MDCGQQIPNELKAKKPRQPAQDPPQVEPDCAQHRVDPIAFSPAQVAAVQQAFVFHVADDRLNAVAPVLVADVGGAVAFLLAGDVHVGQRCALAAAIAPVHQGVHWQLAAVFVHPLQPLVQRVAIVGIAAQGLGVEHEALLGGVDHTDLAAELIGGAGLALGDAGHLRLVQTVELGPVLRLGLLAPQVQCLVKRLIQSLTALAMRLLAAIVIAHTAQIPMEPAKPFVHAPELAGVGVTPDLDDQPIERALVGLAELHAVRLGPAHQAPVRSPNSSAICSSARAPSSPMRRRNRSMVDSSIGGSCWNTDSPQKYCQYVVLHPLIQKFAVRQSLHVLEHLQPDVEPDGMAWATQYGIWCQPF